MKKPNVPLILAYAFVSLVFVIGIVWVLRWFMTPPEGFEGETVTSKDKRLVLDTSPELQRAYETYETEQGDYEGDFVGGMGQFMINKYEGGIQAQKDAINLAMVKFPFDWANAPPSSALFQEQNAIFIAQDDLVRNAAPVGAASTLSPQDQLTERILPKPEGFGDLGLGPEDKVLKSYKPKTSEKLGEYSETDAKEFINEYYDAQGLVPEVVKTTENVYEVVGTQDKNPKIVYEDDIQASSNTNYFKPMITADQYIITPKYARDMTIGLDPSVDQIRTGQVRDYNPNTLSRIFGPGLQWQQYG